MFEKVIGHELNKKSLQKLVLGDRLPSAFLFTGKPGVGKATTARALFNGVNRHDPLWQQINRQAQTNGKDPQNAHPDFLSIQKDGNFIKIKQIEELREKLHLAPNSATKRFVLIQEAENMNLESANAFLKTLEEPPLNTLIILTAEDECRLPETVVSRCQKMSFGTHSRQTLKKILEQKSNTNEKHLSFLLDYSRGCVRQDWFDNTENLFTLHLRTLEWLIKIEFSSHLEMALYLENYVLKKKLHLAFLEFCQHWVRDLQIAKIPENSPHLSNRLFERQILKQAQNIENRQIFYLFDAVLEAEDALLRFAGKITALETFLLRCKKIIRKVPLA